jgi:hypothetical protein
MLIKMGSNVNELVHPETKEAYKLYRAQNQKDGDIDSDEDLINKTQCKNLLYY